MPNAHTRLLGDKSGFSDFWEGLFYWESRMVEEYVTMLLCKWIPFLQTSWNVLDFTGFVGNF